MNQDTEHDQNIPFADAQPGEKGKDQRKTERHDLEATIEFIGDFDVVHAQGIDWSDTGICFETLEPIYFEMRVSTDQEQRTFRAKLAWIKSDVEQKMRWGFEFVPPSSSELL